MPRKPPSDDPPKLVLLPGRGRPSPPPKMSASEQAAWRAIVDASPERYLDGASQLLLKQVVIQITVADRHAERLRRMAQHPDLEAEIVIAKAHRDALRAITAGMTALRATPRARQASRDAGRAFDRSPAGPRPWDPADDVIVDRDDDGDTPA
jgi:hypothetical protein